MKHSAVSLFSVTALISCGDDSEDTVERALQNDFDIVGEWKTECRGAELLGLDSPHSVRNINLTTAKNFTFQQSFYGSDSCRNEGMNFKIEGEYDVVGEDSANESLHNIDFSVESATLTVNSETFVDAMNAVSFCERDDWAVGKDQDITGKSCAGMTLKKGDVIKEIYREKEDSIYFSSQFYFPAKNMIQERPTDVDKSIPYTER